LVAEDDESLLQMRASGASFRDIAAELAVARHRSKLAIPNLRKQIKLRGSFLVA